jgi:regulator of sirC expression with transglutaminase-like and TPR domain
MLPALKIMRLTAFASLGVLLILPLAVRAQQATQRSTVLQDAAYQDCLAAVRKNPEDGFAHAQLWQATGGGLPAQHCAALALVELKHYGDAADRLEKLLPLAEKQAPHLTVAILDQAANAWLLAEQPQRARQLLDIALKAAPDTPDLLIDRAMASAALNDYAAARKDLDIALSADPTREDALALRAAARRQTGDMSGALEDAETALAIQPRLPEALLERGILRLNKGDKRGARADLIQVRLLAPDTPAAISAGQYIEQMDVKQD